jgi:uncharacterized membrane-anchored protein YhcB (DUF1043 family)
MPWSAALIVVVIVGLVVGLVWRLRKPPAGS